MNLVHKRRPCFGVILLGFVAITFSTKVNAQIAVVDAFTYLLKQKGADYKIYRTTPHENKELILYADSTYSYEDIKDHEEYISVGVWSVRDDNVIVFCLNKNVFDQVLLKQYDTDVQLKKRYFAAGGAGLFSRKQDTIFNVKNLGRKVSYDCLDFSPCEDAAFADADHMRKTNRTEKMSERHKVAALCQGQIISMRKRRFGKKVDIVIRHVNVVARYKRIGNPCIEVGGFVEGGQQIGAKRKRRFKISYSRSTLEYF